MFTGLVEEVGVIERLEPHAADRRIHVRARRVLEDAAIGASIAIDGCCLTITSLAPAGFVVEAVPETLARTTLGEWREGDAVNLERAMRLDQRLGGHLVQGHVDGVGKVAHVVEEGGGRRIAFELPEELSRFVAEKGSLAIDGVSLTVAARAGRTCEIAYIPHTLAVTTARGLAPGDRVNLEVDVIARYVARLSEEAHAPGGRP